MELGFSSIHKYDGQDVRLVAERVLNVECSHQ